MFRTITRLLFGGAEETPEDVKSGEVVEEGWLVVTHQEAASPVNQQDAVLTETQQPNSSLQEKANANMGNESEVDAESAVFSSAATSPATSGSFSQPKALAELTQLTCIQKATSWADPHHGSRNAIQRQNRARQGVQHNSFHLQQPGTRGLSH